MGNTFEISGKRIILRFKYNEKLINIIKKSFHDPKWNPIAKYWSVENNLFNVDRIETLKLYFNFVDYSEVFKKSVSQSRSVSSELKQLPLSIIYFMPCN